MSAQEGYREFIDGLVNTTPSVAEQLLRDEGIYRRAHDDEPINSFVRGLPPEDRELIARICRAERTAAIHDALAALTWWMSAESVLLTVNGNVVPVDESGMGLHGDFMARLEHWPWPEAAASEQDRS